MNGKNLIFSAQNYSLKKIIVELLMKVWFILIIFFVNVFAETNIDVIKHISNSTIYDIYSDGENLWAASYGNGIYRYSFKDKKWTNYSTQNNKLSIDFFYCITSDGENVFAGSTDGLFIFDKKKNIWIKRKFGKGGQLGNWIRSLEYDEDENVIWIGRFMYLTKYEIASKKFIDYDLTVNKDVKTNTIKVIKTDGDSLVWFGTENGLHKYNKRKGIPDENSITFYNNRLNYFNRDGKAISVSALLFENNNVWIGLDEFITKDNPNYNIGGLYKYDRLNSWERYDELNGFKGNGIYDLEIIGNKIWVSLYQFSINSRETYGRGLALLDINTKRIISLEDDELPQSIFSLYFDRMNLWLGTNQGVVQIIFENDFVKNFRESVGKND